MKVVLKKDGSINRKQTVKEAIMVASAKWLGYMQDYGLKLNWRGTDEKASWWFIDKRGKHANNGVYKDTSWTHSVKILTFCLVEPSNQHEGEFVNVQLNENEHAQICAEVVTVLNSVGIEAKLASTRSYNYRNGSKPWIGEQYKIRIKF